MKALIALTIIAAPFAFAEDRIIVSPACLESAKFTDEKLAELDKQLTTLRETGRAYAQARLTTFAAESKCLDTYYQNRVTDAQDGILSWRREITKKDNAIAKIESQNFAKYWASFASDQWKALKMMGEGRGPGILLPEFQNSAIKRLKEERADLITKKNGDKSTLEKIIAESQRVKGLSLEAVKAEETEGFEAFNRIAYRLSAVLYKEINWAKTHSGCTKEEVKELQMLDFDRRENGGDYKRVAFDLESLQNTYAGLTEIEALQNEKAHKSQLCILENSYYSGRNADLIKNLSAEN